MAQTPEERKESIRIASANWQRTEYGKARMAKYQKEYRERSQMNTISQSRKDVLRWLTRDNGLEVGLIIPSFIPEGYVQHWNPLTKSYYLTSAKGIMGKYQTKSKPMEDEVIVEEAVEAPQEAENAPESVVEEAVV